MAPDIMAPTSHNVYALNNNACSLKGSNMFKPARDENDQPRVAMIAAYNRLVEVGDTDNAKAIEDALNQCGENEGELLTDDMATAIYG